MDVLDLDAQNADILDALQGQNCRVTFDVRARTAAARVLRVSVARLHVCSPPHIFDLESLESTDLGSNSPQSLRRV